MPFKIEHDLYTKFASPQHLVTKYHSTTRNISTRKQPEQHAKSNMFRLLRQSGVRLAWAQQCMHFSIGPPRASGTPNWDPRDSYRLVSHLIPYRLLLAQLRNCWIVEPVGWNEQGTAHAHKCLIVINQG